MSKKEDKKIIGVQFKCNPKIYHFWAPSEDLEKGDLVAVNTPLGSEVATVLFVKEKTSKDREPTETIEKKITEDEYKSLGLSSETKDKYLKVFSEIIKKYNLSMKPLGVESCIGNRLIFLFASEKRIDFRDLVKNLTHKLDKQIVLKQVGPRDAAREIDGYGPCGRRICCRQFLGASEGVTMDMARDQGMSSKGAAKISGNCGRLMCCLRYEEEYYIEMIKNMPKVGDNFKTEKGVGRVLEANFITGKVQVELADKTKMEVEIK